MINKTVSNEMAVVVRKAPNPLQLPKLIKMTVISTSFSTRSSR